MMKTNISDKIFRILIFCLLTFVELKFIANYEYLLQNVNDMNYNIFILLITLCMLINLMFIDTFYPNVLLPIDTNSN